METSEILTIIISTASMIVSIFAILYTKKDEILLMENTNTIVKFTNITKAVLSWNNNTEKNITKLRILCIVFNDSLEELPLLKKDDLYLNPICNNSGFHYGLQINEAKQYIRVEFAGKYRSIIPFISKTLHQELWYSFLPVTNQDNTIVGFEIQTTYKDEIDQIKTRNKNLIEEYSKAFEKKYKKL